MARAFAADARKWYALHSMDGVAWNSFIVSVERNEWKCDEIFGNQIDDLILIQSKQWNEIETNTTKKLNFMGQIIWRKLCLAEA